MRLSRKLWDNLGLRAIKTLGLKVSLIMWYNFITRVKDILHTANLISLDKAMSTLPELWICHRFGRFTVHPSAIDKMVQEKSYSFGSIRELFIRDCYFRHHDVDPRHLKIIVDLGANRGFFSAMCTPFAERIIAIEPQTAYRTPFEYNMRINHFENFTLINAFLARESSTAARKISLRDITAATGIPHIDFLKMDIEGAEFDVFDDLPLNIIRHLTLEVHPTAGDPQSILRILVAHRFSITTTDSTFRITDNPSRIDYIYAKQTASML